MINPERKTFTRREFLLLTVEAGAGALLVACGGKPSIGPVLETTPTEVPQAEPQFLNQARVESFAQRYAYAEKLSPEQRVTFCAPLIPTVERDGFGLAPVSKEGDLVLPVKGLASVAAAEERYFYGAEGVRENSEGGGYLVSRDAAPMFITPKELKYSQLAFLFGTTKDFLLRLNPLLDPEKDSVPEGKRIALPFFPAAGDFFRDEASGKNVMVRDYGVGFLVPGARMAAEWIKKQDHFTVVIDVYPIRISGEIESDDSGLMTSVSHPGGFYLGMAGNICRADREARDTQAETLRRKIISLGN